MKIVADSLKILKVAINAENFGFLIGFFEFYGWSFFGNISSADHQHMSSYDYCISSRDSTLLTGSGQEIQNVLISLVLSALVAGFIAKYILVLLEI